jgi:hypothetical protein
MLRIILFLFAFFFAAAGTAQRKQKVVDLQDYRYKHQAAGGLRIQTNGLSIYGEYGWIKDIYRTRLIQIEYTYYIDYRQKKQKAQAEDANNYLYGFQNRLHMIHLSYGLERVIADKAARNGVRLSFVFFGGFSLGLLKPYYLELIQPGDTNSLPVHKPERYSSDNESRFLDKNLIYGAAPIRYGLNKIEPVPGIHTKSALNFDWGSKDAFVKALEAGVMLDLYYKRLPIMINNNNRFFQIALFLSFHFGKRW